MLPVSGSWKAEKGGWVQKAASAGTESMWELRRMEEREGSEPGRVIKRRGFE